MNQPEAPSIALSAHPDRRRNVQAADSLGRLMSEVFGQEVRVVYNGKSALEDGRIISPGGCPARPRNDRDGWLRSGDAVAAAL